jgi:hypothetical protein
LLDDFIGKNRAFEMGQGRFPGTKETREQNATLGR